MPNHKDYIIDFNLGQQILKSNPHRWRPIRREEKKGGTKSAGKATQKPKEKKEKGVDSDQAEKLQTELKAAQAQAAYYYQQTAMLQYQMQLLQQQLQQQQLLLAQLGVQQQQQQPTFAASAPMQQSGVFGMPSGGGSQQLAGFMQPSGGLQMQQSGLFNGPQIGASMPQVPQQQQPTFTPIVQSGNL